MKSVIFAATMLSTLTRYFGALVFSLLLCMQVMDAAGVFAKYKTEAANNKPEDIEKNETTNQRSAETVIEDFYVSEAAIDVDLPTILAPSAFKLDNVFFLNNVYTEIATPPPDLG